MYEADQRLVARMRAGESRAFDEFFAHCAPRLSAFAARRSSMDAASLEDIVQNTLIKAVRNLASYRGEAALMTWLTGICLRELADAHRRAARRPAHESIDVTMEDTYTALPLRVPEHREPAHEVADDMRRAAVLRTLNALPEQYAIALEAKYGDGLSVEEIAKQLGVTATAAQSLLARAREAFRQMWRKDVGDADGDITVP